MADDRLWLRCKKCGEKAGLLHWFYMQSHHHCEPPECHMEELCKFVDHHVAECYGFEGVPHSAFAGKFDLEAESDTEEK